MSGWHDDHRSLAAVARRMSEQGDTLADVIYMLEEPRKFEDDWQEVATTMQSVTKPNMVMRSVRVPLALWTAAKTKADERGESISDVIREALERYMRSKR